jgi:hypothetical protein
MNNIKLITTTAQQHEFGGAYTKLIFVKAADKQAALDLIHEKVAYSEGRRIYSSYDCTGEWFAGEIRLRNIFWHKARKMYVARQRWNQDV